MLVCTVLLHSLDTDSIYINKKAFNPPQKKLKFKKNSHNVLLIPEESNISLHRKKQITSIYVHLHYTMNTNILVTDKQTLQNDS